MRTLLASLGVAVLAASALAIANPPCGDAANAATKGGDCGSCPATQTVAAVKGDDTAGTCCASSDAAKSVAAVKGDDTAGGCCSSGAAKTVAAVTGDGEKSGACCMDAAANAAVKGDGECTGTCSSGEAVAAVAEEPQMPAGLPMMTVVVGDKMTHCLLEAGELISANPDAAPAFIVRGVQYDCPVEAGTAYSRLLDAYLIDITTPKLMVNGECQECPISAAKISEETGKPVTYIVATKEFHCPVQARTIAAKAIEASNAVAMKITVGDTDCQGCTQTAEAVAAKTGEAPVYTIGEMECHCPIQAKVMLGFAKIEAALNAATQTEGVAAVR